MSLNIDKAQLDEVLAELAEDIAKEQNLAKAEGETSPDEESEGSSGPAAPPAEASAPPDEGIAPPDAAPPEASAPAAAPEGAPQEGAIEPAPTLEQLAAEYKQLGAQDPEALKNHYMACKQAIVELMGADQGAPEGSAPPPGAPPAEASAPAAPPAAAPPPAPAFKAEMKPSPGNGGKLGKSESDFRIEALEKSLQEEKKFRVEYDSKLAKLVDVMSTPIRKSVKGISDLKFVTRADEKSEPAKGNAQPLSKAEFGSKLRDKLRGGLKLSKSDADLVAGFDMGRVDLSKVQHLIADAK